MLAEDEISTAGVMQPGKGMVGASEELETTDEKVVSVRWVPELSATGSLWDSDELFGDVGLSVVVFGVPRMAPQMT